MSVPSKLLSVYYTAGYPEVGDTCRIARMVEEAGANLIEVGMPFSDPLADGPVLQRSSARALRNGMTVERLFGELRSLRKEVELPVFLMGYWNPVLQFGVDRFLAECVACRIDGVILPDLPLEEYERSWRDTFNAAGVHFVGLIAPSTDEARVRRIDSVTSGFIYAVSSPGVTGSSLSVRGDIAQYLERLGGFELTNPILVGFGIRDRETFLAATRFARGGIVGSAFAELLGERGVDRQAIRNFIAALRGDSP